MDGDRMFFVAENNVCGSLWWGANAQMGVVVFNRDNRSASRELIQ
jgi:hypothetical protein